MIKILKKARYKELLKKEKTLDCRIKDSELSTFEDLVELRKIILDELKNLDFRIDQIQRVYKNLKKTK